MSYLLYSIGQRLLLIASGKTELMDPRNLNKDILKPGSNILQKLKLDLPVPVEPDGVEEKKSLLGPYLPLLDKLLMILIALTLFLWILKMWGLELPLGASVVRSATAIFTTLILFYIFWEVSRAYIDMKIEEESPQQEEHDDGEGGVGDYIETAGIKGMVQHIALRSIKVRHPRGMLFTIPYGDMGAIQNFSRDYIITKLDIRVRYDANIDKIRKIVKRINKVVQKDEELGDVFLGKIKSQGVREMDDSAMILRVKFKTIPGGQFMVRKKVYQKIQEEFKKNEIEFAHRNVTVYLPRDGKGPTNEADSQKLLNAGAAAASSIENKLSEPREA